MLFEKVRNQFTPVSGSVRSVLFGIDPRQLASFAGYPTRLELLFTLCELLSTMASRDTVTAGQQYA